MSKNFPKHNNMKYKARKLRKKTNKQLKVLLRENSVQGRSKMNNKDSMIKGLLKIKKYNENFKNTLLSREEQIESMNRMLKPALVAYAKRFGIKSSGTKAQIIERLTVSEDDFDDANEEERFTLVDENFGNRYHDELTPMRKDYDIYFNDLKKPLEKKLKEIIQELGSVKISFSATFIFYDKEGEEIILTRHMNAISYNKRSTVDANVVEAYFKTLIETHNSRSDLVYISTDNFEFTVVEVNARRGGTFIKLPQVISLKKAVLNIDNSEKFTSECALLCILAHLHPQKKNALRVSKYEKYMDEIKTGNLTFPLDVQDIPKLEHLNDFGLRAFECNDVGKISTLCKSNKTNQIEESKIVNLLYYKGHYTLIRNMSRLFADNNNNNTPSTFVHFV